jgi:hypothetical protein
MQLPEVSFIMFDVSYSCPSLDHVGIDVLLLRRRWWYRMYVMNGMMSIRVSRLFSCQSSIADGTYRKSGN